MEDLQCPYCPEVRPTWSRLAMHVDGVHGSVSVARRTKDLRNPRKVKTVTASAAASEEAEAVGMPVPAEQPSTEQSAIAYCDPHNSQVLLCREHSQGRPTLMPLSAEDLPDGGVCTFGRLNSDECGRDVFITNTPAEADEQQTEVKQQTPCLCGQPLDLMSDDGESWWAHGADVPSPCTTPAPAAGVPTQRDRHELAQLLRDNTGRLMKAGHDMAGIREALDAVDARMRKLDAQLTSPSTVRRATLNQVWDRLVEAGQLEAAIIVMKMITRVVDDQ